MIKNILILGSLPENKEREKLYELIIEVCKNFSDSISSPIDTAKFKGSNSERYERAIKKVKEADLIIGEQSEPSTGQGIEIGVATELSKPLVVIAKTGSKVSGLVRGCLILKEIIYYDSLEDLKSKLLKFLEGN